MSDISKKDQERLAKIGSVLIEKLSKDELRTLSLAHDCGMLDGIFNNQLNPKVADDFPEDFYGDLHPDEGEDGVVGKVLTDEAREVLEKSYEEDSDE